MGEEGWKMAKGEVCRDMSEEVIVQVRGICWQLSIGLPHLKWEINEKKEISSIYISLAPSSSQFK